MPGRLAPSLSSFSALHFNLVESLRISFQSSDLNMPVGGRKGYPRSREVPTPGKIREAGGVQYQHEGDFADMCEDRKRNNYNSGMGEIFRKATAIGCLE